MPSALGLAFAIGFASPYPLLLPTFFGLVGYLIWQHRIIGYRIGPDELTILRHTRPLTIDMADLASIQFPASEPDGSVFGLWRLDGLFGSQGTYWNKSWGKFRAFVTNGENCVELLFKDGTRILVSPDDPIAFVEAVNAAVSM